jgi:hypothetical protein
MIFVLTFMMEKKKVKSMKKIIKGSRNWTLRADNNKLFKSAVSIQKKLDTYYRIFFLIMQRILL